MNARQTIATKPLNLRWVLAVGLPVLVLGGVGWWLFFSEPAPAWRVRARVVRYLKAQSGQSDFSVEFPFPPAEVMRRAPKGAAEAPQPPTVGELTKKDYNALRDAYFELKTKALGLERQLEAQKAQVAERPAPSAPAPSNAPAAPPPASAAQERLAALEQALAATNQALAPIVSDLWSFIRAWEARERLLGLAGSNELVRAQAELVRNLRSRLENAESYAEMYEWIGQELWVAARLLGSAHPDHRRVGLGLARQAAWDAWRYAQNTWLAARICEGYLLPHLDVATGADRRDPLSYESLCGDCARIFADALESHNIRRAYQTVLARATTPERADWARLQLVDFYRQAGDYKAAVQFMKQLQRTNAWTQNRLRQLEDRARSQR